MPDEQGLVRRAAAGEAAAFEEIVRMHQQAVYRVVLGVVGNSFDADDLTQETFIRAHRELGGFRGQSSLRTWLTRIALNVARDHLRRDRVRAVLPLGRREEECLPAEGADPERCLMSRQLGQRLAGFLAKLSERERVVFSLRFAGGHSLSEIANLTETNLSTVKTHLYRALAKARSVLRREEDHE